MEGFVDHYIVLGLPSREEALKFSEEEIAKAYKLKALDLHPDKRPDDPGAREKFQRLKTSYEVLKDKKSRKLFDDLLKIQREKQEDNSQVDSKRRKIMSDLEEREPSAFAPNHAPGPYVEEERITRELEEEVDHRIRAKSKLTVFCSLVFGVLLHLLPRACFSFQVVSMAKDRISDLPSDLRIRILSVLPTKMAVQTSVLSKTWRHLFFFTSSLSFTYAQDTGKRNFMTFVNNVISRRGSCALEKLSLILERGVDGDSVLRWISHALDNGVSDLEIILHDLKHWERPPQTMFVNERLVKLSIGSDICCILPGDYNFNLPMLKTLHLDDVVFLDGGSGFMRLLSGCPVLEDLVMKDMREWCEWTECVVSSKTLKSVTFWWDIFSVEDREERPKSVSFDTPSLLSLDYDDNVAGHYPELKFDSLVEATICLRRKVGEEEEYEEEENDASAFLKGICKVKTLHLGPGTLEVLRFCCQQIPEFTNLSHLEVVRDPKTGWEALPDLLANCPNVETPVLHEEEVRV